MTDLLNDIYNISIAFGLAVLGQLIRLLTSVEKLSVLNYILRICSSGLIGVVFYWLIKNIDMSMEYRAFLLSMVGYIGKESIDLISAFIKRKFVLLAQDQKNEK